MPPTFALYLLHMKKWFACFVIGFVALPAFAQTTARPKLVVGMVVDQMRWDFLYRYADRYTADGFKRLLNNGFSCENAFISYTPTYTAAGHASVYTGSVPALNGIIGNNWYDRTLGRSVYCTDDSTVTAVGSTSVWGKMSPRNLWSNTITDELRLSNNFRGKTIAIALKDRGAILPGGHTANAAYWFDNTSGGWITSTYYMNALPAWVAAFNAKKLPDAYLKQNWNTLYPIATYAQSTADARPYEGKLPGEDNAFPHQTDSIVSGRYESFRQTPYGNTYTFEMAKAAIQSEGLGKRNVTDFLALSFSSPDYIGHTFGPNSIEIEDTYLRLDREIAAFLKHLDATVGKGQYLFFLTADHGAAHSPGFLQEYKLPAGGMDDGALRSRLNDVLKTRFNITSGISTVMNYQVYLNDKVLGESGADRTAVKQAIIQELLKVPTISSAFDLENLPAATLPLQVKTMVANGYNQKLSGNVQFTFKPQYFDWAMRTGTTHGAWYPYDAHIPMVFFGWGVKPGKLHREVYMADIAPTLAAILKIQMPNASVGKVVEELVK